MNALEFLKSDHQVIFRLFNQIKTSSDKDNSVFLFDKIKTELKVHTHLEEKVFYPYIENLEQTRDFLSKETAEDKELAELLESISFEQLNGQPEPQLMKTLNHIEEHILEEERMFQQLGELLNRFELDEIGAELACEKRDFQRYH